VVYEQHLGPGLQATVDGYYYKINDLINQTLDPTGNLIFRNLEQVEAKGVEFELEKRWASGANGRLSYALQRATNVRTGDALPDSPERLAKLNILLPFVKDRLFGGLEEQYTGKRQTVSGTFIDDVWLTNLTVLGRNVSRTVEVSVGVYNLFDRNYRDPAPPELAPLETVQQNGRTVRVKVIYAF
jgi:iron complex outermembrane receptor protein